MPELPDITVYVEAIRARVVAQPLRDGSHPDALPAAHGRADARRLHRKASDGPSIGSESASSLAFDDELFIVLHLMIAGRLHWIPAGKKGPKKSDLAAFGFPNGWLTLTEAGSKRRASLSLVRGGDAMAAIDRGGLEVLDATVEQFAARLRSENHTVKRSLTDPRLFSGIGNAYSDEILHRARMSPVKLTSRLSDDEIAGLFSATSRRFESGRTVCAPTRAASFPRR